MSRRYISVTDTAKLVRADLKKAHPAVKFSVKSSKYAGGASIDIFWTDGPTAKVIDALVDRYVGKTMDNILEDSWKFVEGEFKHPDGTVEKVQYGSHFVSTHRTISDLETKVAEVTKFILTILGDADKNHVETLAYRTVRSREDGESIVSAVERVMDQPRTSC